MSASYSISQYVRDVCYWDIFSQTKDAKICQKFISKQKKDDCLATFISAPTTLEGCKTIGDDKNKNICIYTLVTAGKDYLACKEISDSNMQRTCYIKMTTFFDSGSTEELCNLLTQTQDKDSCEKKLAEATANSAYCAKINNTPMQDNCYSSIGIKNSDSSDCEKILITDPAPWDACFNSIALAKKDATLCAKIRNQETMVNCFFSVSVALNSLGVCDSFPQNYVSSYSKYRLDFLCYKNYSMQKNDPFICNKITDPIINNACMDQNTAFK